MIVEIIRFLFILAGAIAGAYASNLIKEIGVSSSRLFILVISIILGSAIGYVLGGIIGRRLVKAFVWIEDNIQKIPLAELIASVAGVITGLILALLVSLPAFFIPDDFRVVKLFYIFFVFVIFGGLGLRLGSRRWKDLDRLFNAKKYSREGVPSKKILDTNVIIDGRIAEIGKTGFLEGELILPRYVLNELQYIADSDDSLKRSRGRRGLDILREIQLEPNVQFEISERDYPDIVEVDAKLVRQAKETDAAILTNDFNLNKVASVEGVRVLNINELANAIKPVAIPGEKMSVKILREGKEEGQGIGYLDDGTMVVVENGIEQIGNDVDLMVTSVLQTPAGRMIFAKVKEEAK